ncbi:MAG: hypothetical protein JXP73_07925 [Deltaproteobacteria bacterium]|nr:hypothetical protein [Deltaproteobacteria bacterium]
MRAPVYLGVGLAVAFSACAHPNVSRLSVSRSHACAVFATGRIACMGDNLYGQLGDGSRERRDRMTAVRGLDGVVDVAVVKRSTEFRQVLSR